MWKGQIQLSQLMKRSEIWLAANEKQLMNHIVKSNEMLSYIPLLGSITESPFFGETRWSSTTARKFRVVSSWWRATYCNKRIEE